MRRIVLAASAAIAGLALVLGAAPVATAYWVATAQTSVALSPATVSVLATTTTPVVTMSGASGTNYAAFDITNTSGQALTSATLSAFAAPAPAGLTVTVMAAVTSPGTECSTLVYNSAPQPSTSLGALATGASKRYCVRFAHSGATSTQNGHSVPVTVTATGSLESWQSPPSTATALAVVSGAPAPTPPSGLPLATCTPGFLPQLSFSGADPAYTYQLRVGSASGTLTLYAALSSSELAQGWMMSTGNFSSISAGTTFTVVIVQEGTTTGVAEARLKMNDQWMIECAA